MESLHALAARLDEASASLAAVARAAAAAGPAPTAFAADGPGRPGDLGRALYRQWVTATDNRAREASAAAARLATAASAIRDAADRYADTDAAVRHRFAGHSSDRYADTDAAVRHRFAGHSSDRYADSDAAARYRLAGHSSDTVDPWFDAGPSGAVPAGLGGLRSGADSAPAAGTQSGPLFGVDDPFRMPRVPRPRPGDG